MGVGGGRGTVKPRIYEENHTTDDAERWRWTVHASYRSFSPHDITLMDVERIFLFRGKHRYHSCLSTSSTA